MALGGRSISLGIWWQLAVATETAPQRLYSISVLASYHIAAFLLECAELAEDYFSIFRKSLTVNCF